MRRIVQRTGSSGRDERKISQAWWLTACNYSIQEVEIELPDHEDSLVYILNSKLAWTTGNPIKKEKK